jgi:hypothetical protein
VVWHKNFLCQAASWKTARRVAAKVEFHFGELFPRVGFIVTNLETDSRAVVRFLQHTGYRGTVDQGRQAGGQDDPAELPPAPVERSAPVAERARLQPGNLWRRLKHARYCWLLLAESHLARRRFGGMVRRIEALAAPAG